MSRIGKFIETKKQMSGYQGLGVEKGMVNDC